MIVSTRNVRHALVASILIVAAGSVGACSESATAPEPVAPMVAQDGHCEYINGEWVCMDG